MSGSAQAQIYIDLAHKLADTAANITRPYFRTSLKIEDKSDESPVTRADREAEAAMRALINTTFPEHGIIGEEYGTENADAEFVWALDPIDGTISFINGVPLFTTIVGLLRNGSPWLGLVDQPILQDRWVGGAGQSTTLNKSPARVRACSALDHASVYITAPDFFSADELQSVENLTNAVKLRRFGGTDCYHYGMVASGWTDMACEKLSVYEFGAMVPIIESAGGVMTDWQGKALTGTEGRQVLASGDQRIHDAAVEILSKESV